MTAGQWFALLLQPGPRQWRSVLAYNDLPAVQQIRAARRAEVGLRSPDPATRALAWRTIEDMEVASWPEAERHTAARP